MQQQQQKMAEAKAMQETVLKALQEDLRKLNQKQLTSTLEKDTVVVAKSVQEAIQHGTRQVKAAEDKLAKKTKTASY